MTARDELRKFMEQDWIYRKAHPGLEWRAIELIAKVLLTCPKCESVNMELGICQCDKPFDEKWTKDDQGRF